MPFSLRKSKNFGPVRVNLSKSGLGMSVGVKGARVGKGPRGAYVRGGKKGIYFQQSLGGTNAGRQATSPSVRNPSYQQSQARDANGGYTSSDTPNIALRYAVGVALLAVVGIVFLFNVWAGVVLAVAAVVTVALFAYARRPQVGATVVTDGYRITIMKDFRHGLDSANHDTPPPPGYKYVDIHTVVENLTNGPLTPGVWAAVIRSQSQNDGQKYPGFTRGVPIPWMGLQPGSKTRQTVTFTIPRDAGIRNIRCESDPRTGSTGAIVFDREQKAGTITRRP